MLLSSTSLGIVFNITKLFSSRDGGLTLIHLSSKLQRYQWRMRKRREQCPRLTLGSFRSSASHLQRESQCSSTRLSPELFSQNCCVPACRNEIYSHTVWRAKSCRNKARHLYGGRVSTSCRFTTDTWSSQQANSNTCSSQQANARKNFILDWREHTS